MTKCAILGCASSSQKKGDINRNVSYHGFPKDPKLKETWLNATGQTNWFPTKHSKICSIHFSSDSFFGANNFRRRLMKTAIPTIETVVKLNIKKQGEHSGIKNYQPETPKKRKLEKEEEELFNTPKKKKLLSKLQKSKKIIKERDNLIKRLREQNRRKCLKILTLMTILETLKKNTLINEEQAESLNSINPATKELYSRQMKNSNKVSTAKYPPALRSFALTLHYYSTKAYNYVRKVFRLSLPHPRTIYKWYKSINGGPGFTTESLEALKLIAQKSKGPIYCCLSMDEMAIRKKIEWDGKKFHGYVDFGGGLDTDEVPEAKEAFVFLLTGINANWKVPVGYFLVDGANAQQKADLVQQCLSHLKASNIIVVGLTFDGCPTNISMAKILGCKFKPHQNIKTTFEHPITKEPVAIFLDACHMIKLVRNCLQAYGNIIDGDGNLISWNHLVNLNRLQNTEHFHLANKLRNQHIHFQNQKMKVKFATQLLSKSVADSLDFCREKLGIADFKDSFATARFIRIFNDLFDVLNSRNLKNLGLKQPLNLHNKTSIMELLTKAEEYIVGLKTTTGQLIIDSGRKTGFVGLLVCIRSTKLLFKNLIEEEKLKFMPMYKFSQDHLELFFGNIRAHGGCNNNPTSRQFQSFYKKMLGHVEIKNCDSGNCVELEQISLLNCSSAVRTINVTTPRSKLAEDANEQELKMSSLKDFDDFCSTLPQMTEFSEQIITYIGGFVVRSLNKTIKCDDCKSALYSPRQTMEHSYDFVTFKDKGGLIYPSKDVIQICKVAELEIKEIMNKTQYLNINPSMKKSLLVNKILRFFINSNIFNSLAVHQFDQSPTENHLIHLMRAIAEKYIDVRLHYFTKERTVVTKRQVYNKLILFQGQ